MDCTSYRFLHRIAIRLQIVTNKQLGYLNLKYIKKKKPKNENKIESELPKRKRKSWNYEDIQQYRRWFEGQTKTTQNRNARKRKAFCDWIGKTPEQILKEYETTQNKKAWQRERKKEIEAYYNYLKEKGYKINCCRTEPLGILKFHTRHTETIKEGTKCFDAPQLPENEYIFTQETLIKTLYY